MNLCLNKSYSSGLDLLVLLDTHALLWAVASPQRLSNRARSTIEDSSNELLVSAASAWEVATKYRLGKLPDAQPLLMGYRDHLVRLGATEVPITSAHALEAGSFGWDHRDPFDRMIVVQSIMKSATLISADSAFRDVVGLRLLW